jgi:hypothetical protein
MSNIIVDNLKAPTTRQGFIEMISSPVTWRATKSVVAICLWMTLGCTTTAPLSRIVFEDSHQFIRLEVTTRANQLHHSHPASLSENTIAKILRSITINPRPASSRETRFAYMAVPRLPESSPAFSPTVTAFLARHFSDALQRATPLEEVLFFIENLQDQGTALITSGGCYVQEGRLHLQLANYRHPTIGKTEILHARANPLQVLSQPGYDLIPGPHGTVQPPPAWESLVTALPQHVIFEYEPIPQDPRTSRPLDESSEGHDLSIHKTLSEELRELGQAKNEGLITEEEFHTLRLKLLNSY